MSLIAAFGSAALDAIARQAITGGAVTSSEADLGHLGARRFGRATRLAEQAGHRLLRLRSPKCHAERNVIEKFTEYQ